MCRFVRLHAEQPLHVLPLVIALVPDLREGQHARVAVVLQGAFTDAEQSADVSVMQPIRVFGLFSESLQATCGEAQHFVVQTLPIGLCNTSWVHILVCGWYSGSTVFGGKLKSHAKRRQCNREQQGCKWNSKDTTGVDGRPHNPCGKRPQVKADSSL